MSNWKLSRWNYLYLQLLLMLIVMMAVSLIPDYAHEFFGDWKCQGRVLIWNNDYSKYVVSGCDYKTGFGADHIAQWHWGYRHWLFFAFGMVFTIASIARIADGWERREA